MIVLAVAVVLVSLVARYLLTRPAPPRDASGNILDPVGSTRLKNALGWGMAMIAKRRERASFASASAHAIERFHKAEPHPFFNESYYFNGCDLQSQDRVITRISRRGEGGKLTYVILLLDTAKYGALALEADDVPAETDCADPRALGLQYECLEPMERWRVTYKGKMRRGYAPPAQVKAEKAAADGGGAQYVDVELDLEYRRDTPVFWYMRDDAAETLGRNLSQEPWGADFVRVCLKRSKNHGHYEDFGPMRGTVAVQGDAPVRYDFASFRDHSWDIRRWQTMDHLFILLVALETPLRLFGHDYWYLDLTLVSMPGNSSGVARYSTGYVLPKRADNGPSGNPQPGNPQHGNPQPGVQAPVLALTSGTSILDIPYDTKAADGSREPLATSEVVFKARPEPCGAMSGSAAAEPVAIRVAMSGDIRRLMYFPDDNQFQCFEDNMHMAVTNERSRQTVRGYGTRQSGFRYGSYDPSKGGCG